jgi:hypothetical protein
MATPAEQLRQDDLLARYLEASRRALAPRPSTNDLMLARYYRALEHHGQPAEVDAIRTCTSCGRQAHFEGLPGGWAQCSMCGALG